MAQVGLDYHVESNPAMSLRAMDQFERDSIVAGVKQHLYPLQCSQSIEFRHRLPRRRRAHWLDLFTNSGMVTSKLSKDRDELNNDS